MYDDGWMGGWMACMKEHLAEKALADPTKRSPAILGSFVLDTYEHAPCREGVGGSNQAVPSNPWVVCVGHCETAS